jgi:hypothetical protein
MNIFSERMLNQNQRYYDLTPTALAKNSGTLKNSSPKFHTSLKLNFIHVVNMLVNKALLL